MKKFLFSYIIIELIIAVFGVIPLWNFEASTKDLLSSGSHTYTIFTGSACGDNNIILTKTITKSGSSISESNTIKINGNSYSTSWENTESVYCINSNYIYICPTGKNHMNLYKDNQFYEITQTGVSSSDTWELKCYYQSSVNYMFMGYLNKIKTFYSYQFDSSYGGTWKGSNDIYNCLYDFKWTTSGNSNNEYPMILLADRGSIYLVGSKITVQANMNNLNRNDEYNNGYLIGQLTYSNAFFTKTYDKYQFYYLTYDKNPPDFKSGYSLTESIEYSSSINNFSATNNNDSPLDFYYNFTITEIKLIRNTKYAYYEIYNIEKEKTYHGIIDIVLNSVIFNTDEKINVFKPYIYNNLESNSMLAITDNSAYRICVLVDSDECLDSNSCSSGQFFVDSQGNNFCGDRCNNFILIPNKICIDECDENIFFTNDSYHCGFCIHMDQNKPYKLLNS